jgi:hypothetical protein
MNRQTFDQKKYFENFRLKKNKYIFQPLVKKTLIMTECALAALIITGSVERVLDVCA